jgi:radical SAM protein with 4Fe4S-binding SPASM domain
MKRLTKIYLEVTNACNLSCPFCPPSSRVPATMTVDSFSRIVQRIQGRAGTLYFHVKGEPLLHPDLGSLIDIAREAGFSVIITTNGTLLPGTGAALSGKVNLSRVNVSLQSLAHLAIERRESLAQEIFAAVDALVAANRKINPAFLVSYRLWTRDRTEYAGEILSALALHYGAGQEMTDEVLSGKNGARLADGIALHAADTFDWPSLAGEDRGARGFCRALRDQAAILADGTVVPCCLDGDGVIDLGNILETDWDSIMTSARARAMYDGFSDRSVVEPLCRRCGYRTRFGV